MQISMALSLKKDWKQICDIKFSSPPTELYGLYINFEELIMLLPVFYYETNKFFSVPYINLIFFLQATRIEHRFNC